MSRREKCTEEIKLPECTPPQFPHQTGTADRAGRAGGFFFAVAVGVFHGSSLFFLPFQVIANACEKFVAVRNTLCSEVLWNPSMTH